MSLYPYIPTYLIYNAFQWGQDGRMQVSLHVHDTAASPHGGRGSDGAWVRHAGLSTAGTTTTAGTSALRIWKHHNSGVTWTLWCPTSLQVQLYLNFVQNVGVSKSKKFECLDNCN